MSQYDVSLKQAERLLKKNWASVQREAHRLASEGLPVEVTDHFIRISFSPADNWGTRDIIITSCGEVRDDGEKGDVDSVATVLKDILKMKEDLAQQMGQVAEKLANH